MPPVANEAGEFGDLEDARSCEPLGHNDNDELRPNTHDLQVVTNMDNIVEDNDVLLI
jgi:hypothetical protein